MRLERSQWKMASGNALKRPKLKRCLFWPPSNTQQMLLTPLFVLERVKLILIPASDPGPDNKQVNLTNVSLLPGLVVQSAC